MFTLNIFSALKRSGCVKVSLTGYRVSPKIPWNRSFLGRSLFWEQKYDSMIAQEANFAWKVEYEVIKHIENIK